MPDKLKHVLDGYKVLDFTQFLAGPTVTRMMAEMGAEIIKVEIAPIGDFSRGLPYMHDGRSAYYIQQNRGKKSLCLDVRKPGGLEILKDLVRTVDVMVENFSPGVIGRLGLDYQTVSALNPRVVMCSISAMGQTGPLANRPGFDYIGAAYAGVLDMIGDPTKRRCFRNSGSATSARASRHSARSLPPCSIASAPERANSSRLRYSTVISATTKSTCRC
jgi:crotonobetainyl-CoA:carnitine CoA-transferase CaiB-like acyl-CoA transferase